MKKQNIKLQTKTIKNNKRKNIKELFAAYHEKYIYQNIDWGKPQGKELW